MYVQCPGLRYPGRLSWLPHGCILTAELGQYGSSRGEGGLTTAGQGWGQLAEGQKPLGGAGPWAHSPAAQCGSPPEDSGIKHAVSGPTMGAVKSSSELSSACHPCFGDGEKSKANTSLLPPELLDHTDSSTLPIFSTVWGDRFCPQLMQRKKS